ncbi:MAG TPA: response regulator transcription factor [Flavobacteriales bacterium]|nr:response regulator transcription factor [Flavobacteriales bacterium]
MIRVIIAEDHQAFIDGIQAYLEYDNDIKIIGSVNDGEALVKMTQKLRPDIVITDLRMPKLDGLEAITQLQQKVPEVKCIALTMFDKINTVQKVIEAGGKAYLLKNSGLQIMKKAIKEVSKGNIFYDPNLTVNLILEKKDVHSGIKTVLSNREKEILYMIAQGKTTQDIAKALFISHKTVETHRKNMCRKLGIQGPNALLKYAIESKFE